MAQYIDKDVLAEKIERRKKKNLLNEGAFEEDIDLLSFINTLEVKEVDLEKEIDKYLFPISAQDIKDEPFTQMAKCAKHFFELGLKAQKGE